jgi:hypothetical protein
MFAQYLRSYPLINEKEGDIFDLSLFDPNQWREHCNLNLRKMSGEFKVQFGLEKKHKADLKRELADLQKEFEKNMSTSASVPKKRSNKKKPRELLYDSSMDEPYFEDSGEDSTRKKTKENRKSSVYENQNRKSLSREKNKKNRKHKDEDHSDDDEKKKKHRKSRKSNRSKRETASKESEKKKKKEKVALRYRSDSDTDDSIPSDSSSDSDSSDSSSSSDDSDSKARYASRNTKSFTKAPRQKRRLIWVSPSVRSFLRTSSGTTTGRVFQN